MTTRYKDQLASCFGKVALTFERAKQIASRAAHRHKNKMRAYKCRFCHQFHVGEIDGKKVKP